MAALMSAVVFATMSPTLGQQFGELIEVSVIFARSKCLRRIAVLVYPRWIASATSLARYRPTAALALRLPGGDRLRGATSCCCSPRPCCF